MNIGQSFTTAWIFEGKKTICKITYFFQIDKEGSEELYIKQFSAKGIAVCSPTDKYDKEFGKTLASARARQKIERKLEKELIRYSYKNSKKDKTYTSGSIFRQNGEYYFSGTYLINLLDTAFAGNLTKWDKKTYSILRDKLLRR